MCMVTSKLNLKEGESSRTARIATQRNPVLEGGWTPNHTKTQTPAEPAEWKKSLEGSIPDGCCLGRAKLEQ